MPTAPADTAPSRARAITQPLTTATLLAIIGALVWMHEQSRAREADLRKRIDVLAEGYRSQQDARRQLFQARRTIERLRAGMDAPAAPAR